LCVCPYTDLETAPVYTCVLSLILLGAKISTVTFELRAERLR
jgi:hypothetical protein